MLVAIADRLAVLASPIANLNGDEGVTGIMANRIVHGHVYTFFAGDPNFWPRDQTFSNVLKKLSPAQVSGSSWDTDSIMEYDFPPGLIKEPARYKDGIHPPGTLSAVDLPQN